MNKRAVFAGLLYSITAIIFKLTIFLGGYTFQNFGFYYSHFISIILIIPFLFLGVYRVREKDLGGVIGTKEGFRAALTVLAIGAMVMSVYNYIEFSNLDKDLMYQFYNERLIKDQVQHPDKIKTEDFPKIINTQIASLSASRDVTAKLFSLMIMGFIGSFFTSLLMKKTLK